MVDVGGAALGQRVGLQRVIEQLQLLADETARPRSAGVSAEVRRVGEQPSEPFQSLIERVAPDAADREPVALLDFLEPVLVEGDDLDRIAAPRKRTRLPQELSMMDAGL